jgi:hypothetical protein
MKVWLIVVFFDFSSPYSVNSWNMQGILSFRFSGSPSKIIESCLETYVFGR